MQIWKAAGDLTSVYGETSLHVGGVLLTPAPATRYLPLEKSAKGYVMSHFDRDAVEDLKLIKLDLLSIRGLAAISETTKTLRIKNIPPQDKKTYSLLKTAQTIGCFQVESPAMMNLLRRMKPDNVYDLTKALALIRPGPTESGMKEALLRSREGRPVSHDSFLTRILPETDGLLLYEEQVMQIAERVAGMSPDEGDILRRSLKKKEARSPLKERFFTEAGERGYTAGAVKKLWKVMEEFSSYSFNKAHSASYANMAYQAVFLKAHHPLVYLTAVLNAGGGYYGLAEYIEEAKRRGVKVVGPNINRSHYQFDVEETRIRVGLLQIKGLAVKTAKKIIEERQNGCYLSVEDFLIRVSLTKAELFPLIQSGALDSLEPKRTQQILRYFRGLEGMGEVSDLSSRQKERMVVESLGFDPEGDSLSLYTGKRPSLRVRDLVRHVGCEVELIVRVVDARLKGTANGRKYFFLFEDETGLLEGVGETKGQTFGSPPTCYLRGVIRKDGSGRPKVVNCTFLNL
jgi:DNA polymerase III alpha subunit